MIWLPIRGGGKDMTIQLPMYLVGVPLNWLMTEFPAEWVLLSLEEVKQRVEEKYRAEIEWLKNQEDPLPILEEEAIGERHQHNIARVEGLYARASKRQRQILDCIARNMEDYEIAEHLGITEVAVRSQKTHLRKKFPPKT